LLISTFENAVEKNNELIRVNQELTVARDQLTQWNQQLTQLNEKLETANDRMSRDLQAAAKVQHALLPAATDSLSQVDLAWRYIPCNELAGDFLNYFLLDDRHLALFVVDVSGHGVASSLLAVTVGRVLTSHVSASSLLVQPGAAAGERRIAPPAEVMAELNRRFPMEDQGGLYFTIGYGVLDLSTGELRYAAGGHTPLVILASDGTVRTVDPDGMSVGWMEDVDFEEIHLQLQTGDRVFLYSDGVPEAMDEELNEFTDERMLELMTSTRTAPLDQSVHALLHAVTKWCGRTGPRDDVSILALEIK
jgi:sigma-B regulation protein RsbU (phosphoserine phosphatase)